MFGGEPAGAIAECRCQAEGVCHLGDPEQVVILAVWTEPGSHRRIRG